MGVTALGLVEVQVSSAVPGQGVRRLSVGRREPPSFLPKEIIT